MALTFLDGFESYGAAGANCYTPALNYWASGGQSYGATIQNGRYGGKALQLGGSYSDSYYFDYLRSPRTNSTTEVWLGYAYKYTPPGAGFDPNGLAPSVRAYNGPSGGAVRTLLGYTYNLNQYATDVTNYNTGYTLAPNTWAYIEIHTKQPSTQEIYIDGVLKGSWQWQTPIAGYNWYELDLHGYCGFGVVGYCQYDDVYLVDATGTSLNTQPTNGKTCTIQSLFPTSDATYSETTKSSGTTGWNLIDEQPASGTDWVSFVKNTRATYRWQPLTSIQSGVKCIAKRLAGNTDVFGAVARLQNLYRIGGVDYTGGTGQLPATGTLKDVLGGVEASNPATSSAWSVGQINAIECGDVQPVGTADGFKNAIVVQEHLMVWGDTTADVPTGQPACRRFTRRPFGISGLGIR